LEILGFDYMSVNHLPVAFLDVLGFKEMITEMSLEELSKKYEYLINITDAMNKPLLFLNNENNKETITLFPDCESSEKLCVKNIFSDSIILIANDNSELSCLKLLVYVWKLSQVFIAFKMPLRGAITYGEIYVNTEKNIFLGQALTRAYELEESQQWIGVMIDSNLKDKYSDLFNLINEEENLLKIIFLEYDVPFKDGSTKKFHTVNWRWNLIVQEGTKSLFSATKDKSALEKINNALKYAKHVVETGQTYAESENLPVELKSFYIGSTEPPFPHGDEF